MSYLLSSNGLGESWGSCDLASIGVLISRAAVSLSYLAAKAKSKCWKVVVNLVSLALG